MHDRLQVSTAMGLGLGLAVAVVQGAVAQQNPGTAIDIALEPDATMIQHAMEANARLRNAAANAVLAKEKPTAWRLKAIKYYYIPVPPLGLAGIVVEPTEDLHRVQDELIEAVKPYTVKTGTPAAFFSDEGGRDIQFALIC